MSLTYTKVTHPAPTTETREISIPTRWGMFTSAGNRSITQKAKKFYAVMDSEAGLAVKTQAAVDFLVSYRKLKNTKTMSESSDTDVREQVWDFFEKVCDACNMNADGIWDSDETYVPYK